MFTALKVLACVALVAGLALSGVGIYFSPVVGKVLFALGGAGCVKGIGDATGINN